MHHLHSHPREAHIQLINQLCEAITTFVAATEQPMPASKAIGPSDAPNDNESARVPGVVVDEVIGLKGLLIEYGLKAPQVAKLRKSWGFPAPLTRSRKLLFSRTEVESWTRLQPNRKNLAIVLRCRKRRR
jgi:hypothetical protein